MLFSSLFIRAVHATKSVGIKKAHYFASLEVQLAGVDNKETRWTNKARVICRQTEVADKTQEFSWP